MRSLVVAVLAIFLAAFTAQAQDSPQAPQPVQTQESFTAHGSTVSYARPDPEAWNLVSNGTDAKSGAYLLMFKRRPIKDAQGRDIEPVIAIICESVPESVDVIRYSIAKRMQIPFKVNKLMTPQNGDFTHRNSVGFEGENQQGRVLHKVLIAHMRHGKVGAQTICDSTDGVYEKVEADMRGFLRSITFKK
ncbi:MAG: hypothetical protein AB1646_19155 [Thermodesulfobacteriota bacterium]